MKKLYRMRSVRETQMQRGGNGSHGPLCGADAETLFYLATRITPHTDHFT